MCINKFIVVEGIDGSGKSTLCNVLVDLLNCMGIKKVLLVRDPGGNNFSEKIRNLVLSNKINYSNISKKSILLMMYASRIQLIEKTIIPAINSGYYVISDRFHLSTLAYQGYGWNVSKKLIFMLNKNFVNFYPYLTIYLDISPLVAIKRLLFFRKLDFIESQGIGFLYRIVSFYRKYFRNRNDVIILNGNLSKKKVFLNLKNKILSWFKF